MTSNIEGGEYSYAQEAGGKDMLEDKLGYKPSHFKLDIRFESPRGVVILVETKRKFTNNDEEQLREYLGEERILHPGKKIICILANTDDDRIKVWWHNMDSRHLLRTNLVKRKTADNDPLFFLFLSYILYFRNSLIALLEFYTIWIRKIIIIFIPVRSIISIQKHLKFICSTI